jgi:outer membrane protein, heavy metal efflux system
LNQLRGAAPNTPLAIGRADPVFAELPPAEQLFALARTNNFELRLRAIELAQQGFRVALARNERYPTLAIGPTYSEENGDERERIVGIGVSLPLPLWNRNSGAIQGAKARQTQAEVSYAVAEREAERQVGHAIVTYQTRVQEMNKWRADSIHHFKEAAELSDRHYRLGAVPIATYVELQEKYLEAVEGLLDTKKEALDAAQEIQLLTGLAVPLVTTRAMEENK